MTTGRRTSGTERVLWSLAAITGVVVLVLVAVTVWAATAPDDGTDAAGMVVGSAVVLGLPLLVLAAGLALAALVVRTSTRPVATTASPDPAEGTR
ncbi:MAG: hypothetical protein U0R68_07605 [Candidatus Nanopelagicales bacterium]